MPVVILRNGREGDCEMMIASTCFDLNLGFTAGFQGDTNFETMTFPATEPGADAACIKVQEIANEPNCLISVNGLTSGDCLIVSDGAGGTTCIPMTVGGVVSLVPSSDPVFTTLVGLAIDVTLCAGNNYWTRGPANAQIPLPGSALMYHELIGHAYHHCKGTFNASDPEGQAIAEENVLRMIKGLETRTAHEGGCYGGGGGPDGGCFIASAAYESPIAPEVDELRQFRDQVLWTTKLGSHFFEELYEYYYSFSPQIAERMKDDERMNELIKYAFVYPFSIILRLFLTIPDSNEDHGKLIEFARTTIVEFEKWISELPLAKYVSELSDYELACDITTAFTAIPNIKLQEALLKAIETKKTLPLSITTIQFEELFYSLSRNNVSMEIIKKFITYGPETS